MEIFFTGIRLFFTCLLFLAVWLSSFNGYRNPIIT